MADSPLKNVTSAAVFQRADEPRPDLVIFTKDAGIPPGFAGEIEKLADPASVEVTDGLPGKKDLDRGRYLALWNPAIIPEPGAIAALIDHMDENPLAGIAAPAVTAAGRVLPTCGKRPQLMRVLAKSRVEPEPVSGMEVETVAAPPVILRPETLEETGMPAGHAAAVPVLCRRALRLGWQVHAVREAVLTASPGHQTAPLLGFIEICRYVAGV